MRQLVIVLERRGAGDADDFGDLGGTVGCRSVDTDEVSFLLRREIGLLPSRAAFGLSEL